MANRIRHTGVVDSVEAGRVVVRIQQASACASCQAASLCRSSESKEKLLTVRTSCAADFSRGQTVTVEGSLRMGLRAVWMAYVVPTILLVVAVMTAVAMGANEPLAAALGIGVMLPYGLLLWLMRDRLQRQFEFQVK